MLFNMMLITIAILLVMLIITSVQYLLIRRKRKNFMRYEGKAEFNRFSLDPEDDDDLSDYKDFLDESRVTGSALSEH